MKTNVEVLFCFCRSCTIKSRRATVECAAVTVLLPSHCRPVQLLFLKSDQHRMQIRHINGIIYMVIYKEEVWLFPISFGFQSNNSYIGYDPITLQPFISHNLTCPQFLWKIPPWCMCMCVQREGVEVLFVVRRSSLCNQAVTTGCHP